MSQKLKIPKHLKVKHRMMLFMTLSVAVFFSIAIVNRDATNKREKLYIKMETTKKVNNITTAIGTNTDFMRSFVTDYTCWDELVTQVYDLAPQWAEENLNSTLKSTNSDYVWLFDKNMKQIYRCNSEAAAPLNWPIYPKQVYGMLDTATIARKRICTFFKMHNNKMIEICGATIHLSKDQKRMLAPHGFFFFGRILNDSYLKKMEVLTGASVKASINTKLSPPDNTDPNKMIISSGLKGWNDVVVGQLIFTIADSFRKTERDLSTDYYIFISLLILALGVAYYFLVATHISSSLKQIVSSLDHGTIEHVSGLLKKKDEFGKIALMIESSFQQKRKLEEEIVERAAIEHEIMLQKEELQSQAEELHATTDELSHQVDQLQAQNLLITKQSNNILESMTYASRIQNALLPSRQNLKTIFVDHFILYRPRDIVSGDFYYVKCSNDRAIVAAADCTGHGVPGAFLSMLGLSFLNEIVLHNSNISANQILEELRNYTVSSLSQSTTAHEMHVGMDISLCIIDFKTNILEYAGAHSPAFIVRENANSENNDLIELKADNISISQSRKWKSFNKKTILLEPNDRLYLFSDGIIHQFGGPQNRKFGANKLKDLLTCKVFGKLSMEDQSEQLDMNFNQWKGENAQLDDVMILGLKLEKPQKEAGILYEDSFMGLFEMDDEGLN